MEDSMLPLLRTLLRNFLGDKDLVFLGDIRLGDTGLDTGLGDMMTLRAPFMGFTRAPPSNRTRRSGLEFANFIKLVAARLSVSVYAPYWLPVYPSVRVPSSRANSTAF